MHLARAGHGGTAAAGRRRRAAGDPLTDAGRPRPGPEHGGLRVEHLTVRYEPAADPVLHDVSLTIGAGERVLLLGPSGAGKSTLALCCAGLVPRAVPALVEGSLCLDGEDLLMLPGPELAARVGVVLQDPDAQIVRETVFDEVCFALENLRLPVPEIEERAWHALHRVGLTARAGEDPDRLSGGQRQRLAIACALALRPRLLVLDEPTAQLDPVGRRDVHRAMADLIVGAGGGLLLVEHDPGPALALADRVVVLDRTGRIVLDEPPDAAFGRDRKRLVALGVVPRAPAAVPPHPAAAGAPLAAIRDLVVERPTTRGRRAVRHAVLHDVDLEIRAGTSVALVGGNGSGKTTLLRTLAGTLSPARGSVRVGGVDPRRVDPGRVRTLLGLAFQNPGQQFVRETVEADLAQALGVRSPDDPAVGDLLARFGLEPWRQANPLRLSFGQQRRLSVAAAMAGEPPLLLLDEPCAGLDRASADALLDGLRATTARGGAVVMATHDLDVARRWADRAAILAGGELLAEGPAAQVLGDDGLLRRADLLPRPGEETLPPPAAVEERPPDGPLARRNPLAKLAVALPAMLALFLTDNPAFIAVLGVLGIVAALAGSRRARHDLPRALLVALPLGLVMTLALAVWVRPALVAGTPVLLAIGAWRLHLGALGLAGLTVGRVAALVAIGTTFALTTAAADLVRALMRQLRLPYRVGYTVLASYRFVPRLVLELETIRAAHRLRALSPGRGPVATLRRWTAYPFPLLVAAIRHAEQVAVSMDARAFGAYPDRTERAVTRWRRGDTAYVATGLAIAAVAGAAAVLAYQAL